MPKRKFQATEGLLHDVMRKQSGVIEKAYLEALMNSVDANATEFNLEITETESTISDDGDSMTKEEVEKYFEQFGLKDSDIQDKEFGKFRMGRGQIFNFGVNIWRAKENYMVINLDEDVTEVDLPDCTDSTDNSIIESDGSAYTLDTEGLSYAMLDAEKHSGGVTIEVQHYQDIEDVGDTVKEFKKLAKYVSWLHDIEVTVNGEEIYSEPDVIEETEFAYYASVEDHMFSNSGIYNKGAYVDDFNLGPRKVEVITKADLDVTLDRTNILDSDDYWQEIKKEHKSVTAFRLIEDEDLTLKERQWLIKRAADSRPVLESIKDKPLFETVGGDFYTLEEMDNTSIGFADTNDSVAEEAMSRGGVVMINEKLEDSFDTLRQSNHSAASAIEVKDYQQVVDTELQFEMSETPDHKLSKRRLKHLNMIRAALDDIGFARINVKAGYSNHKNVWKDEDNNLYVHKDSLNKKQQMIATKVIQEVVIVAAHDGETMTSLDEDFSLNRNFYRAISGTQIGADADYATVQRRMLQGKYVK